MIGIALEALNMKLQRPLVMVLSTAGGCCGFTGGTHAAEGNISAVLAATEPAVSWTTLAASLLAAARMPGSDD